jgi:hypothetical protein
LIIELAIGAAVIAAAGGVTAFLRRRRAVLAPPTPATRAFEAPRPTSARGLRCGDVVTGPGIEVALHAMIELDEEGLVLRAFRVLELEERWLVQLDTEAKRLAVGKRTAEVPDGAIPEVLPVGGRRVRIERRGTALVRSEGPDLPVMARARYALLSERAGRVVLVIDPDDGPRLALHLDELDGRGIDVLRGGDVKRTV